MTDELVNSYDYEWDSDFITQPNDIVPRSDPVAYFREFCHLHSAEGSPIQFRSMLIFPDGWQYSAFEYEGPEYPPPEDSYSLLRLQRIYWHFRYKAIRLYREEFLIRVTNLEQLQQLKSAPLQTTRIIKGTSRRTGQTIYRQESKPVDFQLLKIEEERIEQEMRTCEESLQRIEKAINEWQPTMDSSIVSH